MFQSRQTRLLPADLAIDLGTANTLVVERGAGVIFEEPSICCFKSGGPEPEIFAAGSEAHGFVGRAAKPFEIVRPLMNGVLSDMTAARELLRFATRAHRRSWRRARPRVLIGVPADATQAERKALATAAIDAGLASPQLLDEPLLSAIGVGLAVEEPRGRMVVDCGAGTTEVAVISLGRICISQSVRGGGEALDRALIDHFQLKHRFLIGTSTAERLKLDLSALLGSDAHDALLEVRGLDSARGVPKTIAIRAAELADIWDRNVDGILAAVRAALGQTPPELSKDIFDDGITLAGGAAMTGLLARRITESTGIRAQIGNAPLRSVAAGLATVLEDCR
ncbi:MAG TPA: rod shape-determining protein MreB [Allosphingosinicella sp.]|jgi:rod shape-determining protein MreB